VSHDNDDRQLQTDTRVDALSGTGTVDFKVPGLTVLWHPDPQRVGEMAPLPGLTTGQSAELSRLEPAFASPQAAAVRPLKDPYLSRRPIRLQPAARGAVRLVASGTPTDLVADGEPVFQEHVVAAERLEEGVVLLLANRVVLLLHSVQPFLSHRVPDYGMVGDSAAMVRVRRDIEHVCDQPIPVLIRGETGTGKELVAAAIHKAGPRCHGPFIALNMGAIPPSLAAAELFGAARGAFTGADQKRDGYFQKAEGGTLFLDEVGETPPEIQVMLLRALETRTVQPVGSTQSERVDVRLTAATDSDLEEAVAAHRFRAPLFHRLIGYEVRLPALRERRDDFGRLFLHFLRQELERLGESRRLEPRPDGRPWVPAHLVAQLAGHDWPGNVRQLANVVRQMVIASRGAPALRGSDPMSEPRRLPRTPSDADREGAPRAEPSDSTADADALGEREPPRRGPYRSPAAIGEAELRAALKANRWHLRATADQLRISRPSLYDLIERHPGIRKARDLSREEIDAARARAGGDLDAMVEALEVSQRGLLRRMTELGLR
jgi:two-component system nitrogen regulation response regulator GlnG